MYYDARYIKLTDMRITKILNRRCAVQLAMDLQGGSDPNHPIVIESPLKPTRRANAFKYVQDLVSD